MITIYLPQFLRSILEDGEGFGTRRTSEEGGRGESEELRQQSMIHLCYLSCVSRKKPGEDQ